MATPAADLVIPRNPDKTKELSTLEQMKETLAINGQTMSEALRRNYEVMIDILETNEDQTTNQKSVWKALMGSVLHPSRKKFIALKDKLTEKYHKVFVKGNFFKQIGQTLKSIAEKTSSFLWTVLKALLVLAIFDPSGKFLTKTVIPFLVKAIKFIVDMVTKLLPPVIKAMINIVFNVLPKALKQLFEGIRKAIFTMFDTWLEEFPKGSIMKEILTFFRDIFAKDSMLMLFLNTLTDVIPYILNLLLIGVVVIKAYTAAIAAYHYLINTNPILGVVTVLIVVFTALWAWRDKIAKWFEDLFDWFQKLGIGFKILIGTLGIALGILSAVFAPFILVIAGVAAAIYGIVKLFQSFSAIGVTKTFELIWTKIKDFGLFIWNSIKSFGILFWDVLKSLPMLLFKGIMIYYGFLWKNLKKLWKFIFKLLPILWKGIKKLWKFIFKLLPILWKEIKKRGVLFWKSLKKFIKKIPSFLWEAIKSGFSFIVDLPSMIREKLSGAFDYLTTDLPKKLKENFVGLFDPIKKGFNSIIDWFNTIGNVGLWRYLNMDDIEQERAKQATKIIRIAEESKEVGAKIPAKLAKLAANEKGKLDFDKLVEEMKKMNKGSKKMEETFIKTTHRVIEERTTKAIQAPKIIPGNPTSSNMNR